VTYAANPKNFGGDEKTAALSSASSSWTQISIPGIAVTTGNIELGVTTTANANQWIDIDDFTLIQE
jgi:hypothetical protein